MQRVRTRLNIIQQDQLITPSTSIVGVRPKQLIESVYHDYPKNDLDRVQMIHDHAMYVDQYDLAKNK